MKGRRHLRSFERDLQARGRSAKTIGLYLSGASRFLLHCNKPKRRLTRRDVEAHLAALDELGLSAASRVNALQAIRAFCRHLVGEGALAENPTEGLRIKAPRSAPVLLTKRDVQRLLVGALDSRPRALALRDRVVVELLYCLGLRSSEARAARVLDLDLTEGSLLVRRAKRGQSDRLCLPPSALPHLRRYLAEGRPQLVGGQDPGHLLLTCHGRPLSQPAPNAILTRIGRRVGVAAHPHALRRACATHLVQAGVSVRLVQVLLGHVSLEATELYIGVDRRELHRMVAALETE